MVLINAFSTDDQKITKDYLEVKPQTKVEEVWLLLSRSNEKQFKTLLLSPATLEKFRLLLKQQPEWFFLTYLLCPCNTYGLTKILDREQP